MPPKPRSKSYSAARAVAQRANVGIGIELLIPLIATVFQTLVTGCVKTDEQKAQRLKKLVDREYSAKRQRYSNMIRHHVERVIKDKDVNGHLDDAAREKLAVAVLDQIRESSTDDVLSVVNESLAEVGG